MSKNTPTEIGDFALLHSEKIRIVEAIRTNREIIEPGEPYLTLGFKTETGEVDTEIKVTLPRLLGIILAEVK